MATNLDTKKPHVLIVGGGLAGLLLAILLDRQGVTYDIYERASKIRALGAVMSLNANILPAFQQLGLYDELMQVSFPSAGFVISKSNNEHITSLSIDNEQELIGYRHHLFARPSLYDILLKRIAPERIHLNKKVTSIAQDDDSVTITCADGTSYTGDILVGADGAYSGVREELYKQLEKEGILPESDKESLSKGYICLVGTTDPVDPEKYPFVKQKEAYLHQVIGEGTPYTWSACNVPGNKICWNVVVQLAAASKGSLDEKLMNAEWGPEANESMIKEVSDFLVPIGGTMGDLINATPKDIISRVFLEDKVFETWNHKRVVLIGDACHKLLPSAGQGAVNAMQDSVVLSNCIYDMVSTKLNDVEAALKDYREQRFDYVVERYKDSKENAKIIYGQTLTERIIRHVVLNYMPRSFRVTTTSRSLKYRPQVAFLPQIPKRGTCPVLPQKPSKRYQLEQQTVVV